VLLECLKPRQKGEQQQSALARFRLGRKIQFCLNGVRHGEMNRIRRSDIDWRERTIRILQGKTGNYKTVGPLGPLAMQILKEFCEYSETDFVFSRSGNITPKFYKTLRTVCERAGVPYGRETRNGIVFHDLRHTATTRLLEDGISPKTVQEWMGWADSSFVLYYSHATKKSREKAGRSLERLANKKSA
jgi:integrase